MTEAVRAGEQVEVSRRELYEEYVRCYRELCVDVRPCRDACLLERAAQYLRREPEPTGTFTLFPFYRALEEGRGVLSTDSRKLLSAFIKAAELLETLCVNLFLSPWKKEIKTLKTFTGPFVYCLLPVFSSSTIQSVLASIGYLPHSDTPQSEYRLSDDVNPDRAMLVGFELLLARVECYHLLELLDRDQLGQQEWLDVLQRRAGRTNLETHTDKQEGEEKEKKKKKDETDRKEAPQYLDTRLAAQPKPRPRHHVSVDHSIMEMQMTYPDLAFRGRPLVPDKPPARRRSVKAVHTASTDDKEAVELSRRDRDSSRLTATGDATGSSLSYTEGSRGDEELRHPQAISLHITLRAGPTAEQRLKPGESQATVERTAWTQQQITADLQNERPVSPVLASLSSMEELQELRQLAKRMGTEEPRGNGENKGGESEEKNLRKPMMETGPALSPSANRCTRSSQSQLPACRFSDSTAGCQSSKGGSTGQQEGEDADRETGRGEDEQLTQTYVIVDHHKQ